MDVTEPTPPDLTELSPSFIEPGRKWLPLMGDFAGRVGTEVSATRDFAWVALSFEGNAQSHTFYIRSLQPAHELD